MTSRRTRFVDGSAGGEEEEGEEDIFFSDDPCRVRSTCGDKQRARFFTRLLSHSSAGQAGSLLRNSGCSRSSKALFTVNVCGALGLRLANMVGRAPLTGRPGETRPEDLPGALRNVRRRVRAAQLYVGRRARRGARRGAGDPRRARGRLAAAQSAGVRGLRGQGPVPLGPGGLVTV